MLATKVGMSLPSRGAWIEIRRLPSLHQDLVVAPLTGSVDRNPARLLSARSLRSRSPHGERGQKFSFGRIRTGAAQVAPLTGSVDRNITKRMGVRAGKKVAPLTGSVDRNLPFICCLENKDQVAPLTGSVDRNWMKVKTRRRLARRSPHGERG